MSDVGGDVATVVTRLGADLSRDAVKMTNEAMKQLLIFLIQRAKEQSDKAGEMALSKLVKSNDEIKMFDLDQKQLKAFNELAKKYEISYAVVKDQNQLSVFYKQGEESRVKLVLEKLMQRELNEKETPVTKLDDREQQQSGLSLIREKLFAVRNDKAETVESKNQAQEEVKRLAEKQQNAVNPYEATDPNGKIEMTFVIDRNGMFERLEKHQLDERVKKILENMQDNQKHHFDVGNKGDRISVERQGNVFIFRAEQPEHGKDQTREGNERTTLAQRLGHTKNEVRAVKGEQGERMSLTERREEIKPLMEAQKQAPPAKNKNRERGGR